MTGRFDGSPAAKLLAFARRRPLLIEAATIAGAILLFLGTAVVNLGTCPAPTDDEMWVFSAAYKLAEEGVFGSDLFAGFYGAEEHYYFNLPAHHFAIAASFKLFGAGVVQGRLVGLVYGVATLLLTYLLARRMAGVPAALL